MPTIGSSAFTNALFALATPLWMFEYYEVDVSNGVSAGYWGVMSPIYIINQAYLTGVDGDYPVQINFVDALCNPASDNDDYDVRAGVGASLGTAAEKFGNFHALSPMNNILRNASLGVPGDGDDDSLPQAAAAFYEKVCHPGTTFKAALAFSVLQVVSALGAWQSAALTKPLSIASAVCGLVALALVADVTAAGQKFHWYPFLNFAACLAAIIVNLKHIKMVNDRYPDDTPGQPHVVPQQLQTPLLDGQMLPMPETLTVTVPPGVLSGQQMQVQNPNAPGAVMTVTVPDGAYPGMAFQVQWAPNKRTDLPMPHDRA